MKKRVLTLCVAILTVLALATGACAEGAFDGLEGVVILTPDEGQGGGSGSAPAAAEGSGLVLTVNGGRVEMAGDTYSNLIFDVSLMNWEMESYAIADAVKATLYYQEEYSFRGAFDFGEDAEIGMLVEETGTLMFSVPHIVAMASVEDLRLELTVLEDSYDQELTPFTLPEEYQELSIPFDYAARETDALELKLGDMIIREKYKGDADEKFKWILQDFYLINWSADSQDLGESTSMLLAYAGKYGFQGEVSYAQEAIDPLEVVRCQAVFHVPNIVAEAGPDTLSLQITLSGEESEQAYDLGEASKGVRDSSGDDSGHPRLGITVTDIDGPDEPTVSSQPIGVQVVAVEDGGPADWAGIQKGDVITEVNGLRIRSYADLTVELDKYAVGDELELKLYRYYDENGRLTGNFEEKLLWVEL